MLEFGVLSSEFEIHMERSCFSDSKEEVVYAV